ncbi:MAG: DUF4399 domain-containing protein [Planctomycetes bacterium]|nr:DUF4399 domain-containing protein [Planctomycetota bacterium]
MSKLHLLFLFPFLALLGACGESEGHSDSDHDHGQSDSDHDHGDPAETGAFVMPEGGRVFFVEPVDGATVSSPFKVVFGVEGVEVRPAGELAANTGHHHIIINGGPMEPEGIVPADDLNIHYGDGQTETEISLDPGEYTLTMQFADGIHRSYGEGFAATITVTVE